MMKSLPRMKEKRFRLLSPSQVLKTIYTQVVKVNEINMRVVMKKKMKDLLKNQMPRPLANRIARKVKKNNLHYLSKLKVMKRRRVQMRNLQYKPGDQVSKIKLLMQLLLSKVQKTL